MDCKDREMVCFNFGYGSSFCRFGALALIRTSTENTAFNDRGLQMVPKVRPEEFVSKLQPCPSGFVLCPGYIQTGGVLVRFCVYGAWPAP